VPRYRVYGLTIDSEFPLPGRPADDGSADVTARWGECKPVPPTPPEGTLLSSFEAGSVRYFTVRTSNGYVIRYPNVCDAVVSPDLSRIELVPSATEHGPHAQVLFGGSILANIMMLGGACVLHASAVETNGYAVGFIGPPGGGKSTMAALACAAGGCLITDDVLRVLPLEDGWHCPAGLAELRLREPASILASLLDGTVAQTLDRRTGVLLDLPDDDVRLGALVFPQPSRTIPALQITRLVEYEVLMRLTSFPRVMGWRDPAVIAQSFRWNARVAREVPAFEAIVPWGPPFDTQILSTLLTTLDRDL
jgi:hypothetical protein